MSVWAHVQVYMHTMRDACPSEKVRRQLREVLSIFMEDQDGSQGGGSKYLYPLSKQPLVCVCSLKKHSLFFVYYLLFFNFMFVILFVHCVRAKEASRGR